MSGRKVNRLASGWLVGEGRFYADPKPEEQHVPKAMPLPGRLRHVGVAPPPGRYDAPTLYTALHVEKGGKVYFTIFPCYWAGNAWHIPRVSSADLYNGPYTYTIAWGSVDGPRVVLPYAVINEDGAIKVIDIQANTSNALMSPYLRHAFGVYRTTIVPSEASAWHDGAPINYQGDTFVVPYTSLWELMGRSIRLKIQKYNPVTETTYMQTVTLVAEGDISFTAVTVPLVKYGLNADGTVNLASAESIGTIELPMASFSGSFIPTYADQTEDGDLQQSFTAYPGFRYTFAGAYYRDGDYYYMPSGYAFIEFGVLVRWGKIYEYSTGSVINTTYDYYRVIDEGLDITYPSGYVAEDIGVSHEPFLSLLPLSLTDDGLAYEATIVPTTTPMQAGSFPNAYLFPIGGASNAMVAKQGPPFSTAWPYYFTCSSGCTLPLSSYPVGRSIAGTKVRRIIARRRNEDTTYYKEVPYSFPSVSSGVYRDGVRYGPSGQYEDTFIVTAFASLSSGMSFSCILPPLSPHPQDSLRNYAMWAKQESLDPLPPLLDGGAISVALGSTPIYSGPLGTIPRPLSDQVGQFMGVDIVASTPFAVAAVRMPSDPSKIWGLLIQDGLVRIWLWDNGILGGWSPYTLSADGTLDIPLMDWLVAPNVANFILDDNYDPYRSLGSGIWARQMAQLFGYLTGAPPSLDLSPVMLNNYLLPGWPFEFDLVGFDYSYKTYQDSVPTDLYAPSTNLAFLNGVSYDLLLMHVTYVDIERQGAMPGAQKRVPVVPVHGTLALGGA